MPPIMAASGNGAVMSLLYARRNASPPDTVPRKLKWSLIIITVVVSAAVLVLATNRTHNEPLTIVFVGFTNVSYADRPLAVFVTTNTNARTLRYAKHIERKTETGWPVYFGSLPHNDSGFHDVPPAMELRLLEYPPQDNAPWRISLVYSLLDDRWGERRWRVAEFFYDRNLPSVGRLFHEGAKGVFAVGPEMRK